MRASVCAAGGKGSGLRPVTRWEGEPDEESSLAQGEAKAHRPPLTLPLLITLLMIPTPLPSVEPDRHRTAQDRADTRGMHKSYALPRGGRFRIARVTCRGLEKRIIRGGERKRGRRERGKGRHAP